MTNHRLRSLLIFLLAAFLFVACSDDNVSNELGTIMFTSNVDCRIRLFDSAYGNQLINEQYEVGKAPVIVQMKYSGVYILYAEYPPSGAIKGGSIKVPLSYVSGTIEHYIEF